MVFRSFGLKQYVYLHELLLCIEVYLMFCNCRPCVKIHKLQINNNKNCTGRNLFTGEELYDYVVVLKCFYRWKKKVVYSCHSIITIICIAVPSLTE